MKDLLRNPELYRTGPNYKATNLVFPVEFQGKPYIVKKASNLSTLANAYYTFQDQFFYSTRKLSTARQGFAKEAEKLSKLNGKCSPALVAYDGETTLVRELLEGSSFRDSYLNCKDKDLEILITRALESLTDIHEAGVAIGDSHIKNFFSSHKGPCWIDFDGVFDERCPRTSKALDLLKFIYSTYTITRNKDLTVYAAEQTSMYPDTYVRDTLLALAATGPSAMALWFPTRLPIDGSINKLVRKTLKKIFFSTIL